MACIFGSNCQQKSKKKEKRKEKNIYLKKPAAYDETFNCL
jgi:hypothetical protein